MHCGSQHYLAEKSILLHIEDAFLVREINHLAYSHNAAFCRPRTNCSLSFPEDEKAFQIIRDPPLLHLIEWFSSGKFFACQYFWKLSGPSKLNFFLFEKTNFRYSLALMVWYWRAYSSRLSLCVIVNLGQWILFLIFSLFKCLLIVLVL